MDLIPDILQLLHEGFVHMEPAGGVKEDHVVAVLLGVGDGLPGNGHRIFLAHLEHRDIQLLAHHL